MTNAQRRLRDSRASLAIALLCLTLACTPETSGLKVTENTVIVEGRGNNLFPSAQQVHDAAVAEAARMTLASNCTHFIVTDERSWTETISGSGRTPPPSNCSKCFGMPYSWTAEIPNVRMRVRMYCEDEPRPPSGAVYDAKRLIEYLDGSEAAGQ